MGWTSDLEMGIQSWNGLQWLDYMIGLNCPSNILQVSTLVQVMACCLTAPSHSLNQCCDMPCLTNPVYQVFSMWNCMLVGVLVTWLCDAVVQGDRYTYRNSGQGLKKAAKMTSIPRGMEPELRQLYLTHHNLLTINGDDLRNYTLLGVSRCKLPEISSVEFLWWIF